MVVLVSPSMPKPLGNVAKLIKSCGAHSTVADNWIVVVKFVGRDELGGGGSDKTWLEMYGHLWALDCG